MSVFKFVKNKELYLYILALLPLLSLFMVSVAIVLFVLGAFLRLFLNNKLKTQKSISIGIIMLFALPFLMYLTSLIWTDDLQIGLKYVGKTLSFFIIPITIFILKPFKTRIQVERFIKIFIFASVTSVLITIIYLFINIKDILNQQNDYWINMKLRESIELVPIVGEHAIYFSLIMATALLLLFYNKFKNHWVNFVFVFILIFGIAIASSKGVIFAILCVGLICVFQTVKNKQKAIIIAFISLVSFSALVYVSPIKERINEIAEMKHIYPQDEYYNSLSLRMAIYNCSFSLIENTPFFGFSPGDTQYKLNECFKKFETSAFDNINYNTHNQYLDYFLAFGVFGWLLIIFSFSFFLRIAILNKDKEYFNFLILFYLVFLTENILVRNTGIVLFTTFNCLFAYSNYFLNKTKL